MNEHDDYDEVHGASARVHPNEPDRPAFIKLVSSFAESKELSIFIFLVIVGAGISVGIQTDQSLANNTALVVIDNIVLWIFVVEAFIKIVACYPKMYRYFLDSWNLFDFTIVLIGLVEMAMHTGNENAVVVIRLFRLLRILKVIKFVPQLRIIVTTLFSSLPSIGYISILLMLLFYIYGVMGVLLFELNDPRYFGSLGDAILTLFRVMTCDSWSEILYIEMNGCENEYAPHDKHLCTDSQGFGAIAVVYFLSFVVTMSFIVLNLFIAIVTSNMSWAKQELQDDVEQESYVDAGLEPPEDPDLSRHKELLQMLKELEDKVEEQARDIMDLQERIDAKY